jgi:PIN domain nuclease of toxin-antitoxin system
MKLLLDTQALIWWINDDPKLGSRARSLIADDRNQVLVSVASLWEMAIKHRIGKLEDSGAAAYREVQAGRFNVVGIEVDHLQALERLVTRSDHKDPFDHLILAQAIAEDAILVTSDGRMREYGIRCL